MGKTFKELVDSGIHRKAHTFPMNNIFSLFKCFLTSDLSLEFHLLKKKKNLAKDPFVN